MKTKPKYYDEIQRLRLIDDELMELCFNDNLEAAELLVRVILGRDDLKIVSAKTQAAMKGVMREVRLDILAVDDEGRKYNIEFQRKRKGAEPERARYHSSMMDVNSLEKGEDFTELPDVYVIFITEHDVLGGGLPIYTIERVVAETGKPFGDRSYIVYVNGKHRDSGTALGRLVQDLFRKGINERYNYEVLGGRVRYVKGVEEEVKEVSGIVEEYAKARAEKAAAKAEKEQQKTIAQRMLEVGEVALDKIAKYTGLSVSTVRRMAKKLEEAKAAQAQA